VPSLRLWNHETIPVGKIIGLGRNYRRHADEMGSAVPDKSPVFFLKPSTSFLPDGGTILVPEMVERVDHEIELGVVIARTGRDIPLARWKDFVLGYAIVLDMTARDLQDKAKRAGDPWALAKGFDTFTPMSTVIDRSKVNDPQDLELQLFVNGEVKQRGHTKDMVFPVGETVSYLSSVMTLERGDVIATGTPEGVGPVKRGDVLEARIPGLVTLKVRVDQQKTRGGSRGASRA
jgi:acylpyruvate hydrolase